MGEEEKHAREGGKANGILLIMHHEFYSVSSYHIPFLVCIVWVFGVVCVLSIGLPNSLLVP